MNSKTGVVRKTPVAGATSHPLLGQPEMLFRLPRPMWFITLWHRSTPPTPGTSLANPPSVVIWRCRRLRFLETVELGVITLEGNKHLALIHGSPWEHPYQPALPLLIRGPDHEFDPSDVLPRAHVEPLTRLTVLTDDVPPYPTLKGIVNRARAVYYKDHPNGPLLAAPQ